MTRDERTDEPSVDRPPISSGYDAELRLLNEVLRSAADVHPGDHVLDIGCGTGLTTRQAARAASGGSALGVDVSDVAIQTADRLAREEGLPNVTFVRADAQVHDFAQQRFDVAISRFGTMFFGDPVAAFTNVRRALRPTGRLVMMVWQARELNDWAAVIRDVLDAAGPVVVSPEPDAFSLGDPRAATDILHTAGFTGVTFTDVAEPVYYGSDVPAALGWIRGFSTTTSRLEQMSPAAAARAVERLEAELNARLTEDGVWFDSRAWIVTAAVS